MDGTHDLGGRQGFGAVDVNEPEEAFHHPWEGRVYGIAQGISRADDWSVDWFRHCRELIEPVDYLTRAYYDQWLQTYAAMMVNSGVATVEELAKGKAWTSRADLPQPMSAEQVVAAKQHVRRMDMPSDVKPAFAPGDRVRTASHGIATHTRLPAYARGRVGTVESHHGTHVFADANALGDRRGEPIYTVVFEATELWPDAENPRDRISLDLWQSHLAPA